jgi:glyoxylase-like metal-dependent hydrolase (beta-lactamase superfamily II)
VEKLHGPNARPECIVLTHGHFDHVGAVQDLAERWKVPVYAHPGEMPYLTGRSQYPPPDPTVGGGLLALTSFAYPRGPIDISARVRPLPEDGSVPSLPGWRWIPTPGHSPGHVSFFRDNDRVLIAGDAFVTTKQESMLAVAKQEPILHGPPTYYTPDWEAARQSVTRLAGLGPVVAATGHGLPIIGADVPDQLDALASHFDDWARPIRGRYVRNPAIMDDERGVVRLPPPVIGPVPMAIALTAVGGVLVYAATRRRTSS